MALATQPDVEARLGRSLTDEEEARLPSLLDDASSVVIGYCRTDFEPAPYPTAVVGVVAKMVVRAIGRPVGTGAEFIEQQNAGPFGVRFSAASASGDVWLTASDKIALRPHRVGGGMTSVQLVGERYNVTEDTA